MAESVCSLLLVYSFSAMADSLFTALFTTCHPVEAKTEIMYGMVLCGVDGGAGRIRTNLASRTSRDSFYPACRVMTSIAAFACSPPRRTP